MLYLHFVVVVKYQHTAEGAVRAVVGADTAGFPYRVWFIAVHLPVGIVADISASRTFSIAATNPHRVMCDYLKYNVGHSAKPQAIHMEPCVTT